MERTYIPFNEWKEKSKQTEYTSPTALLSADGKLQAKGWAKHNVFDYDRTKVKAKLMSRKEWDFYQVSDGKYMVQLSFANINIGGYVGAKLIDLENGKQIIDATQLFLGGKDKYVPPAKGDVPNRFGYKIGKAEFDFNTKEHSRTINFKMLKGKEKVECSFTMDIPEGLENITTVLPFDGDDTKYFMTTKQNCMPCEGTFKIDSKIWNFTKDKSFGTLDWGRVNTPHEMVWYWGNGSKYITGPDGKKHLFGFEITWAIGNESNATETCLFYDGKAHKFGAVDVETFPKPDKFMQPWKFVSEDGRFNLTMVPTFDHHSDMNLGVARMHTHQVHGLWSGDVTLDDGTKLEIKDMYAFCEYVENKW
ncbi:MAG: DUF2804 domain-containing protein [Clostridia bacterium]|nr:DUF2804 domain-containing protein [Clostridia bacterium]